MNDQTLLRSPNRYPSSVSMKIKSGGVLVLPKSWINNLLDKSVLATQIGDVLVLTPQRKQNAFKSQIFDETTKKKLQAVGEKITEKDIENAVVWVRKNKK